jgi:hypothetical protein
MKIKFTIPHFSRIYLTIFVSLTLLFYSTGCNNNGNSDQEFIAQPPYASWSFGVMADSQWTVPNDGLNPNSVAIGVIRQIDEKFVEHKVEFVIQVGDITDLGFLPAYSKKAIDTRALFAQELYNHGIGYYPIRGNHENLSLAASEFTRVFPQTKDGVQNATPEDVLDMTVPETQPPPVFTGSQFNIGSNFNSPNSELSGLSYSFDYENARFILLDDFATADNTTFSIKEQQPWIDNQLSSRSEDTHPFVFTHYGLSSLFKDLNDQNDLIYSMSANSARYLIGGHSHKHANVVYLDTSGNSSYVHNLICAGASSKFYGLGAVPDPNPYPFVYLVSEEVGTIGYYIFTVTGPNVTIDYYSDEVNPNQASSNYQITITPELNFTKRETFGYSLVGKEFVIASGQTYEEIIDDYSSRIGALPTYARILGGSNGNNPTSLSTGFSFKKTINTGWSPMIESTSSDIFFIWGMQVLNDRQPDIYALSLSYYPTRADDEAILNGRFGIATKDAAGKWVNASSAKDGGAASFVIGPWDPSYELGTYGVDVSNNTVWAVLDYAGEFAVTVFQD